jgi:hypothetical protein
MSDTNRNDTAGGFSYLPANQQKAMTALLATTSIEAAATKCGLSPSTIKRYLRDEMFNTVYREQRMLILQEAIAGISRMGTKALEAFEDALEVGDLNERLRAATRVFDMIYRGAELERKIREQDELQRRLENLEIALAARKNEHGYGYQR